MSATDFEYAIKKDVRNNPIVREVDEARQRQLLRAVGIGALLVAVLLFSAWQHFELVQHGYRVERLQQERAAEEEVNRHLSSRSRRCGRRSASRTLATRTAAPGAPGARRRDRHRARGAAGAAREVHRRGALADRVSTGGPWRTNRLAD